AFRHLAEMVQTPKELLRSSSISKNSRTQELLRRLDHFREVAKGLAA
ncbi:hypothetical protein AK812_SmicGene47461, partial [Symbiodinium microadriaticum]